MFYMKMIILKNTEVECLIRRVVEDKISQLNAELNSSELRFQSLQYKAISQSFDNIEEEEDLKEIMQQL